MVHIVKQQLWHPVVVLFTTVKANLSKLYLEAWALLYLGGKTLGCSLWYKMVWDLGETHLINRLS